MANNFLPFCPNDTGTNLESQSDYAAASDRTNGNQPGVAKSKLVNKALRQATYVVGQVAQYVADTTGTDALDNATPAQLLAQLNATLRRLPPYVTQMTSGSGTFNAPFYFFIVTGSATAGATYTNNGVTYTVVETVASGTLIQMTGNGAPLTSGTLTKTGGTGDTTLTFYAVRAPLYLEFEASGGGGGGQGSGTSAGTNAVTGGTTTFGTSLVTLGGGSASTSLGSTPPTAGSVTVNAPAVIMRQNNAYIAGGGGANPSSTPVPALSGGMGASGPLGGGGGMGGAAGAGGNGCTNSGGGGGGGGMSANIVNAYSGNGGGVGGYAKVSLPITSTYSWAWSIGAGGTGGGAGTNGRAGGNGGSGVINMKVCYQ